MHNGCGTVYRACWKTQSRLVAIKVTKSGSKDSILLKEIELLKKCTNDCIVTFYDAIQHDNDVWVDNPL